MHENHAAYLNSWISVLEDKEKGFEFFNNASKQAKQACNYQLDKLENFLALSQNNELKQEKTQDIKIEPVKVPVRACT